MRAGTRRGVTLYSLIRDRWGFKCVDLNRCVEQIRFDKEFRFDLTSSAIGEKQWHQN